eukprot:1220925-Rhodomonas_salina.1
MGRLVQTLDESFPNSEVTGGVASGFHRSGSQLPSTSFQLPIISMLQPKCAPDVAEIRHGCDWSMVTVAVWAGRRGCCGEIRAARTAQVSAFVAAAVLVECCFWTRC